MKTTKKDAGKNISYLSWISATIGLLLVLGGIIYLVNKSFETGPKTPKITIKVLSITKENENYLVMIEVKNNGATASSLIIEGELMDGTGSVEKSSVTIGYVPEASVRKAGIFFDNDPKQFTFILMPRSFEVP